jgi:hypothetical protein
LYNEINVQDKRNADIDSPEKTLVFTFETSIIEIERIHNP